MSSPFVPGARVAIEVDGGYHAPTGYKEAFVDKTFKTGRFTLLYSKQQWRPYEPTSNWTPYWRASETGESYRRNRLRIWDDAADAEIVEAIATRRRFEKFSALKTEIDRLRFDGERVTDEVLAWMKETVDAVKSVAKERVA